MDALSRTVGQRSEQIANTKNTKTSIIKRSQNKENNGSTTRCGPQISDHNTFDAATCGQLVQD